MQPHTFLDRKTWGIANYLLIALVVTAGIAMIPWGVVQALRSNSNNVADWLPNSFQESTDLRWFVKEFGAQGFVVVSWDGCTLGNTRQLEQLSARLASEPLTPQVAAAAGVSPHPDRRLFSRVLTGPSTIAQLTGPPLQLDRQAAIARLEGALVGPPLEAGNDDSRTTCLVAYLGPHAVANNRAMRGAIERLSEIATVDCGIAPEALHLGGPPVDNVTIDIEGERTLRTLAGLSGLVGMFVCYWCLRSWKLTALVLVVAVLSAGASIAMVYYVGALEVLALGSAPRLGRMDSVLMSMPALIYVLALSGAIHLVNYYQETRLERGASGAVERAVRVAWFPCGLAALTTAVGLASLATSDILPIEKFGVLSAVGVCVALVLLFGIVSVVLHRLPPRDFERRLERASTPVTGGWPYRLAQSICRHPNWVVAVMMGVLVFTSLGVPQIRSSVKLLKLLDQDSDLVHDYAWLEKHLGNLVPMEVVLTIPGSHRRSPLEHPERHGHNYAMTTYERMQLSHRVGERIAALPEVSSVLDASTFAPAQFDGSSRAGRRSYNQVMSQAIDERRRDLADYLRIEPAPVGRPASESRELWRTSARITALRDVDYGAFVDDVQRTIAPVLAAYENRDRLVANLAERDKSLVASQICFVTGPTPTEEDGLYFTLLREAGVGLTVDGRNGRLWPITIDNLPTDPRQLEKLWSDQDAVVVLDPEVASQLAERVSASVPLVDLSKPAEGTAPAISAVCTGIVPVVFKTQGELLVSLQESLTMAFVLIAAVMIWQLRSVAGGLIAMLPNLFPIVLVFGTLGWWGRKIDIGTMMTASVALGVAVDDTIHYLSWFRRGLAQHLSRYDAALFAYRQCGRAMVQTTLVAGLGLVVFSFSGFVPTQQFGWLMITILTAALVGDLVMLPAILVGPLGRFIPPEKLSPGEEPVAPELAPELRDIDDGPFTSEPASSPLPAIELENGQMETSDSLLDEAEPLSPPHAALRDKLRRLRQQAR